MSEIQLVCDVCKLRCGETSEAQYWICDNGHEHNPELKPVYPPDADEDLSEVVAAIRKADSLEALKAAVEDAWVQRRARATGEQPEAVSARLEASVSAKMGRA